MLFNYSCDQGSFSSDMTTVLFLKILSKTSQSFQFLPILREETSGMRCVSQWYMLRNVLYYRCYITDQWKDKNFFQLKILVLQKILNESIEMLASNF